MNRPTLAVSLLTVSSLAAAQTTVPAGIDPESAGSPTTQLSVDLSDAAFNPAEHALGDLFGSRTWLDNRGLTFESNVIVDWTTNLRGGVDTHSNVFQERWDITLSADTKKLFGLEGGTFFAAYQFQRGNNSSNDLVGSAVDLHSDTHGDGRSELGQLWYQQQLFDDQFRIKVGKVDGASDFAVTDNSAEFVNDTFHTAPTLYLMPSFPDTGMAIEAFVEPKSGWYAGAGVFDGSIARGYRTGEYGPGRFLESGNDLMLMTEVGKRYQIGDESNKLPGKISLGGWYNTNDFTRVSGSGTVHGTGGSYVTFDQILWKSPMSKATTAGPPGLDASETQTQVEYSKSIALTSSLSWADPDAIGIDANALAGLTFVGFVPTRPIDSFGLGVTTSHLARGLDTRSDEETIYELFYRIRFAQWISLKPDLQYVSHPFGGGFPGAGEPLRTDALAFTLRLEMSF